MECLEMFSVLVLEVTHISIFHIPDSAMNEISQYPVGDRFMASHDKPRFVKR